MQAKSRINPTEPALLGTRARREFQYRRRGTALRFAARDVHDGQVAGRVTDSTRSESLVTFLGDRVVQTPEGLDLHRIVDNLRTHDTDRCTTSPSRIPRHTSTSPPTRAGRLNQLASFFSILERRLPRRGEYDSVDHLAERASPSSRTTTAGRRRCAGPAAANRFGCAKHDDFRARALPGLLAARDRTVQAY